MNRIQFLLQKISTCQNEVDKSNVHDEIIHVSKTAISKIDQDDLLRFIGEKYHDSATDETKKEYANKKDWIVELLVNQGTSMIEKHALAADEVMSESLASDLKAVYRSLQRWVDMGDEKAARFVSRFHLSQKLYGKALKSLLKQLEDKPNSSAVDKQILNVSSDLNKQFRVITGRKKCSGFY
jgi:hypothetical protein